MYKKLEKLVKTGKDLLKTTCKNSESSNAGFIPLVVLVVVVTLGSLVVVVNALIGSKLKDIAAKSEVESMLKQSVSYLDEEKLEGSKINSAVIGTVILPDGNFSAFKVIDAEVTGKNYVSEVKVSLLSGDLGIGFFDNKISPFYLKDGKEAEAIIKDRMAASLLLENGRNVVVKIVEGKVRGGKLVGRFRAHTFTSGHIIAGEVDRSGSLLVAKVSLGAEKTNEAQTAVVKEAIALFEELDQDDKLSMAGVNAYSSGQGGQVLAEKTINSLDTDEGITPFYDSVKGVWSFGGGLAADVSTSQASNIISYFNETLPSAIETSVQTLVTEKIIEGIEVVPTGGLIGLESNSARLKVSTTDSISTLTLDLAGITADVSKDSVKTEHIKDGEVKEGDIASGAVTEDKLAGTLTFDDGDFLNLSAIVHDDTVAQGLRLPNASSATPTNPSTGEGYIAWDASGNQIITYNGSSWGTLAGTGDITGVTAGSGLTGGATSGEATLNIGAGNGITVNADDIAVSLTTSGTTGSTSSNSGLEVSSSGLTLLKGCTDGQLLEYTDAGGWACANDDNSGGGGGSSNWRISSGGLSPVNDTLDLVVGNSATTSAKFGFINVNSGTPTASISANSGNNATYLSGTGTLSTTNAQTLTIGSSATGNITLDAGSGQITLSDNTGIAGNLDVSGTLTSGTADAFSVAATGTITTVTDETINGIDISSGAISDITSLSASGTITFSGFTSNGGVLYTNGSGVLAQATAGTSTQCLLGGTTPSFGSCATGVTTDPFWQQTGGALLPNNATVDVLFGGTSTASAKFGFINVNSGTPTATIAGNVVLDAEGALQTTKNQTLTIGGTTTGNIVINAGSDLITLSDATTFSSNITIAGTTGLTFSSTGGINFAGGTLSDSSDGVDVNDSLEVAGNISLTGTLSDSDSDLVAGNNIDPASDNALDLGDTTTSWRTLYLTGSLCFDDTDCIDSSTAGGYWDRASGALFPKIASVHDLLLGGTSTVSAKFGFINVNSGTPTASVSANSGNNATTLAGTGVLGTTNMQTLTLGNSSTGEVLLAPGGTTALTARSTNLIGAGTLTGLTGLTSSGTITFSGFSTDKGLLYTNGTGVLSQTAQGASNTVLHGNGSSAPTFSAVSLTADVSGILPTANGGSFFNSSSGALFPGNSTLDLLVGATASTSSKFAVLNVNSGNPTASISAQSANQAVYIDSTGTIATTAMDGLTIGGSTTGNITIDAGSGTITLSDGTTVSGALTVAGNISDSAGNIVLNDTVDIGSASTGINVTTAGAISDIDATAVTISDDLSVTGGDISGANSETIDIGEADNGTITLTGAGETNNGVINFDLETNTYPTIDTGADTILGLDEDLEFIGSQSITTVGVGSDLTINAIDQIILTDFTTCTSLETIANVLTCGTDDGGSSPAFDTFWNQTAGLLFPNNSTVDFSVGGQSTASAKFAVLNVASGTPTATLSAGAAGGSYLTATGTLQTTANQLLILGGDTTGNILLNDQTDIGSSVNGLRISTTGGISDIDGDIAISDNTAITGTLAISSTFSDSDGDLIINDNIDPLTDATFDLGDTTSSWRTLYLTGSLCFDDTDCIDSSTAGGYWDRANGALFPKIAGVHDLLLGSSATASAKIGLININSGTPTATISANSGNNASYLSGLGILSTTNMQTLTIGTTSTGEIKIDSGSGLVQLLDQTELGSATTGLRVATTGSLSDIDGNVAIADTVDITGGLTVTTDATITGGDITGAASDSIDIGEAADATFTFTRNDAGTVTLTSADNDADASLTVSAGGTGTLTLGDSGSGTVVDGNALTLQTTGAGTDITLNAVDQIILTDFTTCTSLETIANVLTCGTDGGTDTWVISSANGTLTPVNNTLDILIGGTATLSAKFAVLNLAGGTPTASLSAGTAGGAFINATGTLSTTAKQTLTLGDANTGEIKIGQDATARVMTIGNTTTTTGLVFNSGTGDVDINPTGTGADFLVDTSAGAISLDAVGVASNFSLAADGAADDLTIAVTGAQDASLVLSSAGTGADALQITTTAGGLDISVTGDAAGEDLDITAIGTATEIRITTASTVADAFRLLASAGGIDIDATNSTLVITNTADGAADDFTIAQAGAFDASLLLSSAGTGADALSITATGTSGDIIVDSQAGTLIVDAGEAVADALLLRATGGTTATAHLTSNGTGTAAIDIDATGSGGDIDIDANDAITMDAATMTFTIAAGTTDLTIAGLDSDSNLILSGGTFTTCTALETVASVLTCGTDDSSAGGVNHWNIANGLLYNGNQTVDFVLGGISTASAKFAVTGLNTSNVNVDINGTLNIDTNSTSDDIFRTTTADFDLGSISPSSTLTTTSNNLSFVNSVTAAAPAAGPILTANASATASAIMRPDGSFLIIHGGSAQTTSIYWPQSNLIQAGPSLTAAPAGGAPAGAPAGSGLVTFQRPDGKHLILLGNSTTTNIYDPVATSGPADGGNISAGPALTAVTGAGRQVIYRSDGKVIVVLGGNTTTSNIYDPVNNTFVVGPITTANVTAGAVSFQLPDGRWMVLHGSATTTSIYNPATANFTAGPATTANPSSGAHAFQMADGRYMIILGGNTTTTNIYNPQTNAFSAGPATNNTVNAGAFSFQKANGDFLTVTGRAVGVSLYSSSANSFSDSGNNLTAIAGAGSFGFQRADGKFFIVHAGSNAPTTGVRTTTIYDAGWNTAGSWTSEDINSTKLATGSALFWSRNSQNSYFGIASGSAKQNVQFSVKTAQNQNATAGQTSLADQPFLPIEDNGDLIQTAYKSAWTKVKIDFNVPIPGYPTGVTSNVAQSYIWSGEGSTFYRRNFAKPTVFDFRISNPLVQYGGFGGGDPNFGHNFATPGAMLDNIVTDNKNRLTLNIQKNYPMATASAGVSIASASANLGATAGAGAHAFELPDGRFLIITGSTTVTRYYDPSTGIFTAGPTLPNAVAAGGHTFQLPDGKFMVISGGTTRTTSIYDPIARNFYNGPLLTADAAIGAHSFQRPDGKFVIVHGGGGTGAGRSVDIYDPFLNQFTLGPAFGAIVAAGAGSHTLRLPDGRFMTVLGNAVAVANGTQIYDPARNAYTIGPAQLTNATSTGGYSIQLPDGRFLIVNANGGATTNLFDPRSSAAMLVGKALTGSAGAGGHALQMPDGKYLIINGNNGTATNIFDPAVGTTTAMPAGPVLPFAVNTGAFSFQRQDGKYVLVMGANTAIIDTGWNFYGTYTSEPIFAPDLGSSTALYWKNINGGKLSAKYRTAATPLALGTAAWVDAERNGTLISPATGDLYFQIRFDFQAIMQDYPGSKARVWLGSDAGGRVEYYRQPITPILQYWKLATTLQPSILTLTSNGSNMFRFSADGSAFTGKDGAWYSGGADIAEYYPSSQDLEQGEVVVIDPANSNGEYKVVRSTKAYEGSMLGIVSTKPGFVAGAYTVDDRLGKPFAIALVGRVPTKVSLMNGIINAGDPLTSSPIPGVAMKAVKAGAIIGRALESYSAATTGTIEVSVEKGTFNGLRTEDLLSSLIQLDATNSAYLLTQFLNQDQNNKVDVSEIVTDRIIAGMEVITPKVTTSKLSVDTIMPSTGTDVALSLTGEGEFVVRNDKGETAISFDSQGNAYFAGTLTADKVRANQIEGLSIFTNELFAGKLEKLEGKIAGVATSSADLASLDILGKDIELLKNAFRIDSSASATLDMTLLGSLSVDGGLVVAGTAEFKGETLFEKLVTFASTVIFKGDVGFEGRPTFNKDTAGFAVIKEGAKEVKIVFEKEYAQTPVVTANALWEIDDEMLSMLQEKGIYMLQKQDFVVAAVNTRGFRILLENEAVVDLKFSWTALMVKDAKTHSSLRSSVQATPASEPIPSPTSTITPTSTEIPVSASPIPASDSAALL